MQHNNPTSDSRMARAPYNFVPLPDKVVLGQDTLKELPAHDMYHLERYTGHIECEFVTKSPLYVRSAVNVKFYQEWSDRMDDLHNTKVASHEYAHFFNLDDLEHPFIPGSSLRGMVRSLMEIVAHGHTRWVADKPTFTFRAVAAPRSDPLSDPYQSVIGRFGRNICAGYLRHEPRNQEWFIQPAMTTGQIDFSGQETSFIKVKENVINSNAVKGFRPFNSQNYKPSWFPVRFDVQTGHGDVRVTQIADYSPKGYRNVGLLVSSGNMLETGDGRQQSPRRNHTLVLAPNRAAKEIKIDGQAIDDYLAGLTTFQKENLQDWGGADWGCLKDGAPIFYAPENDDKGMSVVRYFGHSPNFRIPARLQGANRASNPLDFVPELLRKGEQPDITEGMFGWVEEKNQPLTGQSAGRVFFGDARYTEADDGIWLKDDPITLHTLSEPKPTTFQHYLVQNQNEGHDPNNVSRLAHYGMTINETQIRGYKRYWSKGSNPEIEASPKERQHPKQLTQVKPVKPGVHFSCKIRFENLNEIELGALLWTLSLPGDPEKEYCHMLGMGKPLGMGGVSMSTSLHLEQRQKHYSRLFAGDEWHCPMEATDLGPFIEKFEQYSLEQLNTNVQEFKALGRIRSLLTILEWRDEDSAWQERTRYQEIERGSRKDNEYKDRPVLPTPEGVAVFYKPQTNGKPLRELPPQSVRPAEQILAEPEEATGYIRGRVVSFGLGRKRSYGFIQSEDSTSEFFVHRNHLAAGVVNLEVGQIVRFKEGHGPNGPEAQDVQIVN